jgi:PPOX class probable F420-dependent enzyme
MEKQGQFIGQSYLNLETYRRSGEAMPTPVWFIEEDGMFYIRTMRNAGKVKRVRNVSRVRIMPCGQRGEPRGEWVEGQATIVDEAASAHVNGLLNRKYGLLKRLFDLMQRGRGHDVIKVEVQQN